MEYPSDSWIVVYFQFLSLPQQGRRAAAGIEWGQLRASFIVVVIAGLSS